MAVNKIEYGISKNELPIFTLNGLSLCSTFYPDKEAEKWVSHIHSDLEKKGLWNNADTLIILGLGCGYRVAELANQFPGELVVLELDSRAISFFNKTFIFSSTETKKPILINPNEDILSFRKKILEVILGSKIIKTVFEPSTLLLDTDGYNEIHDSLMGRSVANLSFQLKSRKVENGFMEKVGFLLDEKEINNEMSIKDLLSSINEKSYQEGSIDLSNMEACSLAKWRLLGELVR